MDRALTAIPKALPGRFDTPPGRTGMTVSPAVSNLVHAQVQALLEASPAYHDLPAERRAEFEANLHKIATYTAALVHEEWTQSKALGQRPMLVAEAAAGRPATAKALAGGSSQRRAPAAEEFSPRAARNVAGVTRDTLNAIAFPTFVADLIKGTFQAIVKASIQQMEAYGALLANVAKTVDQFMADNITDNNARDWLVGAFPSHLKLEHGDGGAKVAAADNAPDSKPDFRSTLGLEDDVDPSDAEEKLVPAARRYLARSRHQMLSTMMLMGVNRIVITSGRIYAKMGFHIDASDKGAAESASQFDTKTDARLGFGGGITSFFGGPSGEIHNTTAYVSSTKRNSSDEINVSADLTGEVDLKFKSDYFPMERFAKPELMSQIMGNTANPSANSPVSTHGGEGGAAPAAGGTK